MAHPPGDRMNDKVAIALPFRDMVHAMFAYDLALLSATIASDQTLVNIGRGKKDENDFGLMLSAGTLIADQRCNLVAEALKEGADWILWLDSDMRFPRDAFKRLRAHNKPIVGCNYSTRRLPVAPTAKRIQDNLWVEVPTKQDSTGLEKVNGCGFGCMLTSTEVFRKIPEPWFLIGWSGINHKAIGEDIFFCLEAGKAGYDVLIDHDLSKEIAHIGTIEYMHQHVEAMAEERAADKIKEQAKEAEMIETAVQRAMAAKANGTYRELDPTSHRYAEALKAAE